MPPLDPTTGVEGALNELLDGVHEGASWECRRLPLLGLEGDACQNGAEYLLRLAAAQDEAFEKGMASLLSKIEKPRQYGFRLGQWQARMLGRKRGREGRHLVQPSTEPDALPFDPPAEEPSAEERLDAHARVRALLEALPPAERLIAERLGEGHDLQAILDQLRAAEPDAGWNYERLKKRVQRLRQSLPPPVE